MKKIFILSLLALLIIQIVIPLVSAHCPLCTAAAAGGVAIARFYGVDDSIVGLLLGAVIVSTALWFGKWMKKKDYGFVIPEFILVIASFLVFAIPFYYTGLITNIDMVKSMPEHHSMLGLGVLGIDKLLAGMIIGSLAVWEAFALSDSIKKKRGKVLWDYQGLSFMIIALIILSLIFWILTKGV